MTIRIRLYRGIALLGMLLRELTSPQTLQRQSEPEPSMEDESSVEGFHFAAESLMPVYHFNALAVSRLMPKSGVLLDLGSGSGQFLAYLAEVRPDIQIIGMDLSNAMVNRGRRFLDDKGLTDRVSLNVGDMMDFSDSPPDSINVVCAVFSLHHLPTREHLLKAFEEIRTVRQKFGCAVWIFDLVRPRNPVTPGIFPEILTPDTPTIFKEDTRNSLIAAWSYQEMINSLTEAGLGMTRHSQTPLLHFYQTHWLEPKSRQYMEGHGYWIDSEQSLDISRLYQKLKRLFPKSPT